MGKPLTFAGLINNGYVVAFAIENDSQQLTTLFHPNTGDVQEVLTSQQEVEPFL